MEPPSRLIGLCAPGKARRAAMDGVARGLICLGLLAAQVMGAGLPAHGSATGRWLLASTARGGPTSTAHVQRDRAGEVKAMPASVRPRALLARPLARSPQGSFIVATVSAGQLPPRRPPFILRI